MGVGVYGAALFAAALIEPGNLGIETGIGLIVLGAIVILFISGLLWLTVGGEAAFGALAAGLTLILVGLLGLSGIISNWGGTVLGLAAAGAGFIVVGAAAASWCRGMLSKVSLE